MRLKRLGIGIVILFVIALIFGGIGVIAAYLDGERSVIGAFAWSLEWSYGVSPILFGVMLILLGAGIISVYTGLRSSKRG